MISKLATLSASALGQEVTHQIHNAQIQDLIINVNRRLYSDDEITVTLKNDEGTDQLRLSMPLKAESFISGMNNGLSEHSMANADITKFGSTIELPINAVLSGNDEINIQIRNSSDAGNTNTTIFTIGMRENTNLVHHPVKVIQVTKTNEILNDCDELYLIKNDLTGFTKSDNFDMSVKIGDIEKQTNCDLLIAGTVIDNTIESLSELPVLEVYVDDTNTAPDVSVNVVNATNITFISYTNLDQSKVLSRANLNNAERNVDKVRKLKLASPRKYRSRVRAGKIKSLSTLQAEKSIMNIK